MPLFANSNNQLSMLNTLPRAKERTLQRLVENNLPVVLDMKFIASEYRTTSGGRIDTLAVDNDGAPVIIEYKRDRNDNVINQSLSYLKWLQAQKQEFFEMLMLNQLGNAVADNIRVDWKHPRIVCVAESYSKFDIDTVQVVQLRIDLYKYRLYEGGLFSLEKVNMGDQHGYPAEACQTVPTETAQGIVGAMKSQSGASHTICTLFDELREQIMELDEGIVEKPGKRVVAYRVEKNFAEILIRKDKLVIDLRPTDYTDPRNMVEEIGDNAYVTMNRRITLTEPIDLEYVFGIIEQSYQNVL